MQRRGVAHALVVTCLAVVLCLLIARLSSPSRPAAGPHPTRTSASVEPHAQPPDQHRAPPPAPDAKGGGDQADPDQSADQEIRPRPPTDIPSSPISYVRRVGVTNGVALTIDDGPHPVWTPRFLDLLARYHVHAVFCLIGEQVQEYPALVHRIAAEGHTLCDHTWNHDTHLSTRSDTTVDNEIDSTYQAIVTASGGVPPVYYRAPGGDWDRRMTDEARRLGMVSLNWSVDPVDWSRPGVGRIVSAVLGGTGPGDIVLVHDGGGDRSQTLAALRTILPALASRGYSFVTP